MEFVNGRKNNINVRIGKRFNYTWITVRPGETIDLPKKKGKRYGLVESNKKLQNVTEGKIGKKKVETKQFEKKEASFYKELVAIKGIGYKTAEDIVEAFTEKELIKEIKLKQHLPFRDDVAAKLIRKYGK